MFYLLGCFCFRFVLGDDIKDQGIKQEVRWKTQRKLVKINELDGGMHGWVHGWVARLKDE